MAFGSNESFKTNSGVKSKSLNPGKHRCKVSHISAVEVKWPKDKTPRLMLSLHLISEKPDEDFIGFTIDQNDLSKGCYDGQVAYVKTNSWGYQDNNIKDKQGKYIPKEMLAAQFLHWLCINANGSNWVNDNLGVHKTFADFIAAFNKENPIKDAYLNYCIGGTKEMKDNGYYKYTNLSLVNVSKEDKGLGLRNYTTDANVANLIPFNAELHIYDKTGGAELANFDGESNNTPIEEEKAEEPTFVESDSDVDFTPVNDDDDPFAVDVEEEDPFAVE